MRNCYLCMLIRGLENLESFQKELSWFVRMCYLCALNRGLKNLETSCEGERVVTFCIVQKVTKKHARTCKKLPVASFCASETAETGRIANGCEQGDHVSRRRRSPATSIQIAGRTVIVAKNNRRSSGNRFCEKLQLRRASPAMI